MVDSFLRIGHRGAAGHLPENTLASFERAIALGVHMIELDVHLCGSGEIVVIHDERVDRTTDGRGEVAVLTLAELKRLDAGGGERIPLLMEVLDLVARRVAVNIELKGGGTAGPVVELIAAYIDGKGWTWDDFLLSSFSRSELAAARELSPSVRLGLNLDRWSRDAIPFARSLEIGSIHPDAALVDKGRVARVHVAGMKLYPWTVDDTAGIGRLKGLGVDGIFSNYPERL